MRCQLDGGRLLTTLLTSLPALGNVLAVFVLILLTYSVLGMHLFRHVHWRDPNADFCTFSAAFLTMFRCATGEARARAPVLRSPVRPSLGTFCELCGTSHVEILVTQYLSDLVAGDGRVGTS